MKSASEEARELLRATLDLWFPRCVSPEGWFHQAFARDWSPLPEATRFQVFQSRMTWVAAVGAECFPERREEFEKFARHGINCLTTTMRDREYGGTLWESDLLGMPIGLGGSGKRCYGAAFELFARSAVYRVFGHEGDAAQCQMAFWTIELFRDPAHGGWYEWIQREGTPILGEKVFNTHLHVFEALAEWSSSTRLGLIGERLQDIVQIFSEKMATPTGRMLPLFGREWNPISDEWEIGHDLEAAYLLLDSGIGDPAKALKTIDFALTYGFDHECGGFYQLGNANGEIVDDTKVYWTQDEGLNALIAAWKATEEPKYEEASLKLWAWIRDLQWDAEFGGTFSTLTPEGELIGDGQKAEPWKACYHDVRAFRSLWKLCE